MYGNLSMAVALLTHTGIDILPLPGDIFVC